MPLVNVNCYHLLSPTRIWSIKLHQLSLFSSRVKFVLFFYSHLVPSWNSQPPTTTESPKYSLYITHYYHTSKRIVNTTKWCVISIVFQQWHIRSDLIMCKSRSLTWNWPTFKLSWFYQYNSKLSKTTTKRSAISITFQECIEMRKIGSRLTLESAKVDCCLKIKCNDLTCLHMLITMPQQLGSGQNYHQKK